MKKCIRKKAALLSMLSTLFFCFQSYAYWVETDSGWMFACPDGSFLKNQWEWIDGNFDGCAECYYFDDNGYCLIAESVDGAQVNDNGAWVEDGIVQSWNLKGLVGWHEFNGTHVYLNMDGNIWRDRVTLDNFYVNEYGWKVVESGIDEEMMREKSKDCRYIVMSKSSHQLELWNHGTKTHSFVITSGYLEGDKEFEGDMKTPEGEFYVCKKVPNSLYYMALALNYPTIEDAERGLRDGLISQNQYKEIKHANENGNTPNWYTPLGGEIEIHGNRQPTDATRGCVGMRNEDIELLYSLVSKGDRVLILP